MQSSNRNNDANRDELDGIQRQINQRTDESLESTRRMLGLVAESQEVGTNTMIMLDEQGEKLNKIEEGLDNIHVHMNEAETHITNLQKCCGLCVLPWNRRRRVKPPKSTSNTTLTSSDKSSPTTTEPKSRTPGEQGMPSSGYIARITGDDREEEMDDNLQLVSSYLGNLKNIALDMTDTITAQTNQIDSIAEKTEAERRRVAAANKQTQNILRKN